MRNRGRFGFACLASFKRLSKQALLYLSKLRPPRYLDQFVECLRISLDAGVERLRLAALVLDRDLAGALLNGWWWWWAPPIVVIVTLFVGLFLISQGLDEWANPRLRRSV